ncbi:MAG: SLC45 family MFS transporter [Deinococcales bacterium]|nr:SLC45 family MFS transporter [Deinococcales bacterium]
MIPLKRAPDGGLTLSNLGLLGLGIGAASLSITWGLYNIFMPLLLREFIGSSGVRGAIMGIDNVLGLLFVPLIGAVSDRLDGPLGKRLPFLMVSMPLAALFFAALPFARASLWTLLAVDIVFLLAMTAFRAPLAALMPDHVAPAHRPWANAVITMLGAIGGALALVLVAPWSDHALWIPFAVAGGVTAIALVAVRAVSQPHPPYVEAGAVQEETPMVGALLREARRVFDARSGHVIYLLLAVFCVFFGYSALEAQFSTFATEEFGLTGGRSALMMGATVVGFVLLALPAGRTVRRLGEVNTMRIGTLMLTLWLAIGTFVTDPWVLAVFLMLGGASWAFVLVPAYPAVVNQGGADQTGFYTGMYYLFGAVAAILAPAAVGWAMDVLGNVVLLPAVAVSMVLGLLLLTVAQARLARVARGAA